MFGGSFCIPPSPSAIDLALGHIGHAQYQKQDDKFSPSVFKVSANRILFVPSW